MRDGNCSVTGPVLFSAFGDAPEELSLHIESFTADIGILGPREKVDFVQV